MEMEKSTDGCCPLPHPAGLGGVKGDGAKPRPPVAHLRAGERLFPVTDRTPERTRPQHRRQMPDFMRSEPRLAPPPFWHFGCAVPGAAPVPPSRGPGRGAEGAASPAPPSPGTAPHFRSTEPPGGRRSLWQPRWGGRGDPGDAGGGGPARRARCLRGVSALLRAGDAAPSPRRAGLSPSLLPSFPPACRGLPCPAALRASRAGGSPAGGGGGGAPGSALAPQRGRPGALPQGGPGGLGRAARREGAPRGRDSPGGEARCARSGHGGAPGGLCWRNGGWGRCSGSVRSRRPPEPVYLRALLLPPRLRQTADFPELIFSPETKYY